MDAAARGEQVCAHVLSAAGRTVGTAHQNASFRLVRTKRN